jgi:hypothetical protein
MTCFVASFKHFLVKMKNDVIGVCDLHIIHSILGTLNSTNQVEFKTTNQVQC